MDPIAESSREPYLMLFKAFRCGDGPTIAYRTTAKRRCDNVVETSVLKDFKGPSIARKVMMSRSCGC
eukprot:scaffold19629_cov147-Amphora_coffeaeformis.AAC.5